MASSSEAFEKFLTWKNRKTSLRLKILPESVDRTLIGKIIFVDEEEALLSFGTVRPPRLIPLLVENAEFTFEGRGILVEFLEEDDDSDFLLEEIRPS